MSRGSTLTLYRAYPKFTVSDEVFLQAQKEYESESDSYLHPKTEGPDLPEIMMLKPHREYIVGEDGIHHKVEPKTVEEYRLRHYTGNFLRDRRVWCDELLRWDFGSSFDVLIDRYSLNPCFWKRSSILLTKDVARKMLVAAEYILGGVWDDRMSLVAKNEFVKLFTDGYNCTSYWKYLNRHAIEANQKVFEFENEGCKVIVKLPDRKRRSNGSYTRADAECDEEIECWLRNIASATRAYLESDEYSYNDEHELLLEYRCWG